MNRRWLAFHVTPIGGTGEAVGRSGGSTSLFLCMERFKTSLSWVGNGSKLAVNEDSQKSEELQDVSIGRM